MQNAKICLQANDDVHFLIVQNLTNEQINLLQNDDGKTSNGSDDDTDGLKLVSTFDSNNPNVKYVSFQECCQYETHNIFSFQFFF